MIDTSKIQSTLNGADFAPKLTHQPHSVTVQPNKPHTSECPVESQPESDVKWFKDNKLLQSEPMHLEQTGSELMFFLVNDKDTGDYHCEASNHLGTVTSEQFRLTVQSSKCSIANFQFLLQFHLQLFIFLAQVVLLCVAYLHESHLNICLETFVF